MVALWPITHSGLHNDKVRIGTTRRLSLRSSGWSRRCRPLIDSGVRGTAAVNAAARVTDKAVRIYRAALTTKVLETAGRVSLFAGYNGLEDIVQAQRIGATLPLDGSLRDWFQSLADAVIAALDEFIAVAIAESGDV